MSDLATKCACCGQRFATYPECHAHQRSCEPAIAGRMLGRLAAAIGEAHDECAANRIGIAWDRLQRAGRPTLQLERMADRLRHRRLALTLQRLRHTMNWACMQHDKSRMNAVLEGPVREHLGALEAEIQTLYPDAVQHGT